MKSDLSISTWSQNGLPNLKFPSAMHGKIEKPHYWASGKTPHWACRERCHEKSSDINNLFWTPHSYFSLKWALRLPPFGNFLFPSQYILQVGTYWNFIFIQSYSNIRSSTPALSPLFSGSRSAQQGITVTYELVTAAEVSFFVDSSKKLFSVLRPAEG